MKTSNFLTLSDLRVCPFSPYDEITTIYPATEFFETRRHFLLSPLQTAVAVHMTFFNERCNSCSSGPGIRHRISVSFFDATSGDTIGNTECIIHLSRGEANSIIRLDIPFAPAEIDMNHEFRIAVKDISTGILLGNKLFYFFDENKMGQITSEWFSADSACLVSNVFNESYRSIDSALPAYQKVRFRIHSNFKKDPKVFPELEIRIHFPDGRVQSKFVAPVAVEERTDAFTANVDSTFFVNEENRGICYAELICIDYPIAGVVFSTAGPVLSGVWESEDISPLWKYSLEEAADRFREYCVSASTKETDAEVSEEEFNRMIEPYIQEQEDDVDSKDESEDRTEKTDDNPEDNPLQHFIGLVSVKEKLYRYEKLVTFNKMRKSAGLPVPDVPLHAMFLGSPGTGKTTVAKRIGTILQRAGILSKGHVVVKERSTLIGQNYGSETENTLKALDDAQGGILLIDEAYQLFQPKDPRDPGKFVIEALLTALADNNRRDWMLILAGYPEPMRRMFDMNPGFKSRIPDSNIYTFEDFSETELMDIATNYLDRQHYALSPDAAEALSARLTEDYRHRDNSFGNARHVINLIKTDIIPSMAARVIESGFSDQLSLTQIHPSDIPQHSISSARTTRAPIGFR